MSYESPEPEVLDAEDEGPVYYVSFAWLMLSALLLVELLIQLAGAEGAELTIRARVISYFGYLSDAPWQAEPWRAVSHIFVHAAPAHLVANAVLFLLVGPLLCRRIGWRPWAVIWFGAGIAAAVAVSLTAGSDFILVGATGAVFGLIGAAKLWEGRTLWQQGESWQRFIASLCFIAVIGLVMNWLSAGAGSFVTPFAGFLFGAAVAAVLPGKRLERLIL